MTKEKMEKQLEELYFEALVSITLVYQLSKSTTGTYGLFCAEGRILPPVYTYS
jgi:hypothetical protein